MDVRCTRCGTEYEFDDALISERGTSVRCTQCGHQFKVFPPQLAGIGPDEWIVLTSLGRRVVYRSLRELQNGISKAEVAREDLLARGSKPPRPLGSIAELDSLFVTKAAPERQPSTLTGVAPPAIGHTKADTFAGVAPPPDRAAARGTGSAEESKAIPPPGGSLGREGHDTFSGVAPPATVGGTAGARDAKAIPPPGGSLGKEGHDTFSGVAPPPKSPEDADNPYANRGAPLRVGGNRTVLGIGSLAPEAPVAFEPRHSPPASELDVPSPPETLAFDGRTARAADPDAADEVQVPPLPPEPVIDEQTVVEATVTANAESAREATAPLELNTVERNRTAAYPPSAAAPEPNRSLRETDASGTTLMSLEELQAASGTGATGQEHTVAAAAVAQPSTDLAHAAPETRKSTELAPAHAEVKSAQNQAQAPIARVQLEKKLVRPPERLVGDPEPHAAGLGVAGTQPEPAAPDVTQQSASRADEPLPAMLPVAPGLSVLDVEPQPGVRRDVEDAPARATSEKTSAERGGDVAAPHQTKTATGSNVGATSANAGASGDAVSSMAPTTRLGAHAVSAHVAQDESRDQAQHRAHAKDNAKDIKSSPRASMSTSGARSSSEAKATSAALPATPERERSAFPSRALLTVALLGLGVYGGMKIVGSQMHPQATEPRSPTTIASELPASERGNVPANSSSATGHEVPPTNWEAEFLRRLTTGDLPGAEQALYAAPEAARDQSAYRVLALRTLVLSADLDWWKLQLIGKQAGAEYTQIKQTVATKVERYKRDIAGLGPDAAWSESLLAAFLDVRKLQNEKGELNDPKWSIKLAQASTAELKYSKLVAAWIRAGVPEESTIAGLREVRAKPSDWGPHAVALLVALVQMNRLDDARAELKALGGQTPPHPLFNEMQAYVNRAEQANLAPSSSAAPADAPPGDASETDPDLLEGDFRVRLTRANECLARNELTRAQKLLRSVLVQRPNDTEAITAMGDLQKRRGDLNQARTLYEKAMSLNGNYLPALSGAADVKWRTGDRAGAAALYRRIVERVGDTPGYGQTATARLKELEAAPKADPVNPSNDAKPGAPGAPGAKKDAP
jgi:predicted Zn finger-like uncharacterized protein